MPTGKLKIYQYQPGERARWVKIEMNIFDDLRRLYVKTGNFEETIEKATPTLKKWKNSFQDEQSREKFSYHTQKAGKRLLEYIANPNVKDFNGIGTRFSA